MNRLLAAAATVVAIAALAFAFAPASEIRTEIEIAAPPAKVWQVLTDNGAYPQWNPFIVEMKGRVAAGETLTNSLVQPGSDPMTFSPTVLAVTPEKELRWIGRLFAPRIFDGEHYFQLEPTATGTRFVHGENFRGVLLWFISTDQFKPSFEAMNAALKARAETVN